MNTRLAVLDLGTNTFHLMVAEVVDGKPVVIFRDRRAVKLGKGGINQRTILPDAMERAMSCMRSFKADADKCGVSRIVAIGTSALRGATNGQDLLAAIRKETGVEVKVITGEQEANYIYLGVREAVNLGNSKSLIVDIGGGSVEFIIADSTNIFWKASLDIGAQRLMELYHRQDPISTEDQKALTLHYDNSLVPLLGAMSKWKPGILVGSSGTFDTLSEIHCNRQGMPYFPASPEAPLTVESFWEIHKELLARDRAARLLIPGMIEMRVDMVVVASCLIAWIIERFALKKIRVSSYSLKEGVLASLVPET